MKMDKNLVLRELTKVLQEEDFSELESISSQLGIVSFVLTPDQENVIVGLQGLLEHGGLLFLWILLTTSTTLWMYLTVFISDAILRQR